jgi:sensor domain CHASE-containing protein
MKIQTKMTLVNLSITFLLIIMLSFTSDYIINKSFLNLEDKSINEKVNQFKGIRQKEMEVLNSTNIDWGKWSETYYFVNNQNPIFPESNLDEESMKNLGLDFMAFTNKSNDLFFISVSPSLSQKKQEGIKQYIKSSINDISKEFIGEVSISEEMLVLSSVSITTSDRNGNFSGYLIMGYFIEEEELSIIQNQIKSPIELAWLENVNQEALKPAKGLYLFKKEDEKISVYIPISDVYNEKIGFFKLTLPREIYKNGKSTVKILFLSLWVLFLIFFISIVVFNYFLSKKITTPLSNLKKITKEIDKGNLNLDFNLEKDNEINPLAESIKKMVEKLKESQRTLEEKVVKRTKELEEKNKELEKLNKLTIGRELEMIKLKKRISELEKQVK